MKRDLSLELVRIDTLYGPESGWCSHENCMLELSRDGAWYAGPLHVNPGPPLAGHARKLRYALKAGRTGEHWLDGLSVMVFGETGDLLAQLDLPSQASQEQPCELDVRALHLPLQSKLRVLLKTPRREGMRSAEKQLDSWLALAA